jgi:carbamoyltransferase
MMNSVLAGKILQETPFESLFIQPAAGDAGTALGAAYSLWHERLDQPRSFVMEHALWGSPCDGHEVQKVTGPLRTDPRFEIRSFDSAEALCRETASILARGAVVGWMQGRMEWGARALGNRSILADPRQTDTRERLNRKIKKREEFRPFAASVLQDAVNDYYENAVSDPFMLRVHPVRRSKRAVIPAVTHVDGSGRVQTVDERTQPLFSHLVRAFGRLTGVPLLLNTSFNESEPIVESPAQALDCFLRTDMDALALGRTMVRRRRAA